ncbi:MAG: enoyl-CoA hydratase/isomerase family protein, partial [Chitinophagaceae bacterium]|nr:enoyl-CoA hydratase/isomerase family protein [Chitinophagaceae bacterium]
MTDAYVRSSFHHGITTIEFFHPQSNSLPGKILDELAQAIHGAGNDTETKLVLLRSAG